MALIDNLEKMLAAGQDTALLRYGLGSECLKLQRYADAVQHLSRAVGLDAEYSAAWKISARHWWRRGMCQAPYGPMGRA